MISNKIFKANTGLTLIEILIGIIVSSIMMAAIYTTYSIVNNTYSQVLEKAKVSRSSRDIIELLIRDARMAGYKYYLGNNEKGFPKKSNLTFLIGTDSILESHDPIIIEKDKLGHDPENPDDYTPEEKNNLIPGQVDACCDKIHFVYDDFNQNDLVQPYKRYRVTYFAKREFDGVEPNTTNLRYAIYKSKSSWQQPLNERGGEWNFDCPECYRGELIRDYVEDIEFIALDKDGRVLTPVPNLNSDASRENLYKISSIDIRIAFRSEKPFFRFNRSNDNPRELSGFSRQIKNYTDRNLRDNVVVTVHTRNVVGDNLY